MARTRGRMDRESALERAVPLSGYPETLHSRYTLIPVVEGRMVVRNCAWIAFIVGLSGLAATAVSAGESVLDCGKERTDARVCLACNVYHEARGESIAGQRAVAMVVRNRARSSLYPLDICSVVWEVGRDSRRGDLVAQFSWTRDNLP